jgi:hypothetical protein
MPCQQLQMPEVPLTPTLSPEDGGRGRKSYQV